MIAVSQIYVALGALLLVVLTFRVIARRRGAKVGIGDGGDKELLRRVRVHGNAIETLPIGLLLLVALELFGLPAMWLHIFGSSLLAGRVLHAWGLSGSAGTSVGRMVGMLLTLISITLMSGVLLVHSFM